MARDLKPGDICEGCGRMIRRRPGIIDEDLAETGGEQLEDVLECGGCMTPS